MIGRLPKTINVSGTDYKIRSDYRDCLNIICAFQDQELNEEEKFEICLTIMYEDIENIQDKFEAFEKAVSFLDREIEIEDSHSSNVKLYDWEQDEQIIFSAINKVAGKEVRELDYMHWWTFLGLFSEIGRGAFSTVVSIRDKKSKGEKLEDWERDFIRENKSMIELKTKRSAEEQALIDKLNEMYS